jgi:hypothetical protein
VSKLIFIEEDPHTASNGNSSFSRKEASPGQSCVLACSHPPAAAEADAPRGTPEERGESPVKHPKNVDFAKSPKP